MKMISPSNREVDVGKTLSETEWIGMCRREVFDDYLRKRAKSLGANIVNGLMMKMEMPQGAEGPIMIQYNSYEGNSKVRAAGGLGAAARPAMLHLHTLPQQQQQQQQILGWLPLLTQPPLSPPPQVGTPATLEVDCVIGADGANSRVAKEIGAGEYDYAIAFQVRGRARTRLPGRWGGGRLDAPAAAAPRRMPCALGGHSRAAPPTLTHPTLTHHTPHTTHTTLTHHPTNTPLLQERIRIPDDKMRYYENLAEMYVGDDVSPDFYGWVFPKYDHVAVGTGTVVNKTAIKQYQQATRDRSSVSRGGAWAAGAGCMGAGWCGCWAVPGLHEPAAGPLCSWPRRRRRPSPPLPPPRAGAH
jgi:hypothetical protein